MSAARNRPRSGLGKDDMADEVQLWNNIVEKIKRCRDLSQKFESTSKDVESLKQTIQDGEPAKETIPKLDEIEKRHREEIKLSEEELRILNDGPDDLLQNLETLINVRTAFEAETPRTSNTAKSRTVKRGRAEIDGANDSPAPTPEVSTPGPPSKVISKQNPSRSASVAASTPIVKIETGVDPATSNFNKLQTGAEVFYRHRGKDREGEGIQGKILNVTGEGKNRKYEIQDIEPDLNEKGEAPSPYKAKAESLVAIPARGTQLPEFSRGKQVLALYPFTTTFYKAEVVGYKKDKDQCRLRFEGEEEKNKEQDVDRRYVLDVK